MLLFNPCLELSVLLSTLCLNSVGHGPRTELQPRWLATPTPCTIPPCHSLSILSFFHLNFCMFQVSCTFSAAGISFASIPPPASYPAHLPASCGPQCSGWLFPTPLSGSMTPAWFCTQHVHRRREWHGGQDSRTVLPQHVLPGPITAWLTV